MSATREQFDRILSNKDRNDKEEHEFQELGCQLISETHRVVGSIWHEIASRRTHISAQQIAELEAERNELLNMVKKIHCERCSAPLVCGVCKFIAGISV